jgi:hypothetical protein
LADEALPPAAPGVIPGDDAPGAGVARCTPGVAFGIPGDGIPAEGGVPKVVAPAEGAPKVVAGSRTEVPRLGRYAVVVGTPVLVALGAAVAAPGSADGFAPGVPAVPVPVEGGSCSCPAAEPVWPASEPVAELVPA